MNREEYITNIKYKVSSIPEYIEFGDKEVWEFGIIGDLPIKKEQHIKLTPFDNLEELQDKFINESTQNYVLEKQNRRLQQENKQLKEKYLNAVSDYEYEKWKTQRIKTLIEDNIYIRNGEKYIIEDEINEILEILKGE